MRFVRVIEPNVGGDFGLTADGTRYNGHALKEWRTSPVPGKRAAVARQWSRDTMGAVVLQGAVVTPAAVRESYPRTCSGYHDHVYWCCPAVAEKLGRRPRAPEDWWQRRFGWPLATADSEQGDEEVINWMVKVTQLAWDHRYHSRQNGY